MTPANVLLAAALATALAICAILAWRVRDHLRVVDALESEKTHLDHLVEYSPEAIALVDKEDRVQRINREFTRLFGYAAEEAVGRFIHDLIAPEDLHEEAGGLTRRVTSGTTVAHETVRRRKDGSLVHVSILGAPVMGKGGQLAAFGIYRDISDQKAAEEQLLHLAIRDDLTGLANRALFRDLVSRSIGRGKRREDYACAILVLDVDRFKIVNESLGHALGDQLLRAVGRRLERCVRPGDTVARLGGDEFAIFLDDTRDVHDAIRVADRIQTELRQPFILGLREVFASASVGIALSTSGYDRPDDFVRDADLAMYRAKELGGARHEVFESRLHARAVALLQLETDLRRAVEREELRVHYQPIVSVSTGRVTGFEALVRWEHPQRGLVGPGEFIGLAEDTGLIVKIGHWVLARACRQVVEWHRHEAWRHLHISVNLSGRQLVDESLPDDVATILMETGLDPARLRLEITESVIVENAARAVEMLARLRSLGVQLHMDDFGTGYSSLSYLHRFQIDTLKIDKSFIQAMGDRGENSEIVRTIVTLARNLGIDVIAEGVETSQQLAQLRALGCANVQGFLFSRPVPREDVPALLEQVAAR